MKLIHKNWIYFCEKLADAGILSVPAKDVKEQLCRYVVLKHDVETDVAKAYAIAKIEHSYGHRGSYYVQAYLLDSPPNVALLRKMQSMGHEISYHYDVMDSCKGNLLAALHEFEGNKKKFEENGFMLETVCQHGNPVVERVGYTSNRDFFRSLTVQTTYPEISDIMVNFKEARRTEYTYYSDAGRQFNMIFDPLFNDIYNSDDKNVAFKDLDILLDAILNSGNHIISIHPHRWNDSEFRYTLQTLIFKAIKSTAKCLLKIPGMKKVMGRFYFLAKKI